MYNEISDIAKSASNNGTYSIFPESLCYDGCCCTYLQVLSDQPQRLPNETDDYCRYGKRASSPTEINASMLDDRQVYLYQDKMLTVVYQSKLSYY